VHFLTRLQFDLDRLAPGPVDGQLDVMRTCVGVEHERLAAPDLTDGSAVEQDLV
jgi:hypothetical protein